MNDDGGTRPMRSDHWRIEAHYVAGDVDDLAELRRRIIDAGHPAQTANGLIGWLVSKMAGEPDATAATTRSRYRKILTELGPPPDVDRAPTDALEPVAADPAKRRRLGVVRGGLTAVGWVWCAAG